jgi:hypothetical protein
VKKQVQYYLELNRLEPNLQLARLLPPDLALRYHALPVAKDGERITVAMAAPDDLNAREVVLTALGKSTCIVQADINTIDGILEDLWHENVSHTLNFLTWLPSDSLGAVVKTYAQNLSALLGARLSHFETSKTGRDAYKTLVEETKLGRADMVIFREPCQSLLKRMVKVSDEYMMTELLPISSLLVYGFRWPIKKILLVIRNEESDEISLNWTLNLAKASGAFVTVLAITIPVPGIYAHIQPNVPTLLTTDCPLGRKMRWVAHRLADWEIEGTLRLRNESPNEQIRCEVIEGEHDLIVIAAEPQNWLRSWINGELVKPLLNWADRPVLVANPYIY